MKFASSVIIVSRLHILTAFALPSSLLWLTIAPQSPRPYIIPKLAGPTSFNHFPVTGNSSGGAFTLLTTDSPGTLPTLPAMGVFPHLHRTYHENFYCTKGRVGLWAATNATGDNARMLTAGDYGAVPQNTTHTFQLLEPDTMLTGVIAPGGFEKLFFHLGPMAYRAIMTPPTPSLSRTVVGTDGVLSTPLDGLEEYDVSQYQLHTSQRFRERHCSSHCAMA